MDLADIPLVTIDGRNATSAEHASSVELVVNVASSCGLSPQYAELEELQRRHADRGSTVLGFPSDSFEQELSSEAQISEYCSATWGVTFPMFERVAVNGEDRHPLYAELVLASDAEGTAGDVQGNFEEFLITPDGSVHRFRPRTEPDAPEVLALIENALPR